MLTSVSPSRSTNGSPWTYWANTYAIRRQPVVVEQITDNVAADYYEVILRTARLQEPYDVEKETQQPDDVIREIVKVVSSESSRCSGTTLIVTRVFRRRYIWYDGHETMDDYDSTEQLYYPESAQCGFIPTFTLKVNLHLTNCKISGIVTTSAGAYSFPTDGSLQMEIPIQDGDTAIMEGTILTDPQDMGLIDITITKDGEIIYQNRAVAQPAIVNQTFERIAANTEVTIEATGYYEDKPPRQ